MAGPLCSHPAWSLVLSSRSPCCSGLGVGRCAFGSRYKALLSVLRRIVLRGTWAALHVILGRGSPRSRREVLTSPSASSRWNNRGWRWEHEEGLSSALRSCVCHLSLPTFLSKAQFSGSSRGILLFSACRNHFAFFFLPYLPLDFSIYLELSAEQIGR